MKQYLAFLKRILDEGVETDDRTKTGTLSIFGHQMRFDLSEGFPLLTTKKVHVKSIIHELLWFIQGKTNIYDLVTNNVRIWNEWPYENYRNALAYQGETLDEFIEKIKVDRDFADAFGDLGPVYGRQWRAFAGKNKIVDQLRYIVDTLKEEPTSRRLIVSSWNPTEIDEMALPPCHVLFQFHVSNQRLSCQLYQRSADAFLGVPFNIASYSLLTLMVAQIAGYQPGEFIHTIGDGHIYFNHLKQVNEQLSRTPKSLPTMRLNPDVNDLFAFKFEDFTLEDYQPHPAIKGKVSV